MKIKMSMPFIMLIVGIALVATGGFLLPYFMNAYNAAGSSSNPICSSLGPNPGSFKSLLPSYCFPVYSKEVARNFVLSGAVALSVGIPILLVGLFLM